MSVTFLTNEDKEELLQRDGRYYAKISDALSGTNPVAKEQALVHVYDAPDGTRQVILLADVTEAKTITISEDLELHLNGHTLTMQGVRLTFNTGTTCRIIGQAEGSAIVSHFEASTAAVYAFVNKGALSIIGGRYRFSTDSTTLLCALQTSDKLALDGITLEAVGTNVRGLYINAGSADIRNSTIMANGNTIAYAIGNNGNLSVKDSYILGDAPGAENGKIHAYGINNIGTATIEKTEVLGTMTGVYNAAGANVYVSGGRFAGYSYGGFYFAHGAAGAAYINDATVSAGVYEGSYTEEFSNNSISVLAGFYVGKTSETAVYLDGCTLGGETYRPLAIRESATEQRSAVYMSNTTVIHRDAGFSIGSASYRTNTLYIGAATNVTLDMFASIDGDLAFTGLVYRRLADGQDCSGLEYAQLRHDIDALRPGRWNRYVSAAMPDFHTTVGELAYNATTAPTLEEIYAGFDALVTAHPGYVTRQMLGMDASGTYPVYRYDFTPTPPVASVPNSAKQTAKTYSQADTPVFVMDSGIHGLEKPAVLAMLNFCTILANARRNDIFGWLRHNVRFVVVPVANPWGYVNSRRSNANSVDLNRNFTPSWENGESTDANGHYRGAAPLSEPESQYINAILQECKDSALAYYSWHTHGVYTGFDQMTMYAIGHNTAVYEKLQTVGLDAVQAVTLDGWANHNLALDSGYIGAISVLSAIGSAAAQGSAYGIPSVCPECIARFYDGPGGSGYQYTQRNNQLNVAYLLYTVAGACKVFLEV